MFLTKTFRVCDNPIGNNGTAKANDLKVPSNTDVITL